MAQCFDTCEICLDVYFIFSTVILLLIFFQQGGKKES